jgi:hypothetical protein
MLQGELLEKQAINGSIEDELKRLQVRLAASETERELLEVQSADAQIMQDKLSNEISALREDLRNEEASHHITLNELASVRAAKAVQGELLQEKLTEEVSALRECLQNERAAHKVALGNLANARHDKPVCAPRKNQSRFSMSAFITMAACSRARLPHIIPTSIPLQMLTNTPCWDADQYLEPLSLLELSGSMHELRARLANIVDAFQSSAAEADPVLGCYCFKLGQVLHHHYDFQAAVIPLRRALSIFSQCAGYEHDLGATCLMLACALAHKGGVQSGESEELAARGLALHEAHFGKFDPALSKALICVGSLRCLQGNVQEAKLVFTRAVALAEQLGEYHPCVAEPLSHFANMSVVRVEEQERQEILESGRRALLAFQRKYGSRNHVEVGHTCAFVASALWVGA